MDKLLKKLDFYINKYKKDKYKDEDKIKFLLGINIDDLLLYDNSTIIKILYSILSENDYKLIVECLNELETGLNSIGNKDCGDFMVFINYFEDAVDNNTVENLFINNEIENKLEKFDSIKYPTRVKEIIFKIIKNNNKELDYDKYNLLISFLNDITKVTLMKILQDILIIRSAYEESKNKIENMNDNINKLGLKFYNNTNDAVKEAKSNYEFVVSETKKIIIAMNNDLKKYNKTREKKLNFYIELKNNVLSNKEIDISKLNKNTINERLLVSILIYNIELKNKKYHEEKELNNNLTNNNINKIDKLLNKFNININSDKIIIEEKILENKLILIDKYMPEVKTYNNIMIMLINMNYDLFNLLVKLISNNDASYQFILKNVDYFYDNNKLDNFKNNIKLLTKYNINISNVIKYDVNLLFNDSKILENNINIYRSYKIKLSNECYNYELLNKDYSYIIDKFIEIGEYELIKNNPGLINDESITIIKRCIVNKEVGNICLNEQVKLKGNLRKESSFFINDSFINEIVIENFTELMNKDILNILISNEISYDNIDLNILKSYEENEFIYNINGFYVSTNKIIKNMNKLLNSELSNVYSYNELLYYSIIYNYPKLITLNDINNLNNILNIKLKKLIK